MYKGIGTHRHTLVHTIARAERAQGARTRAQAHTGTPLCTPLPGLSMHKGTHHNVRHPPMCTGTHLKWPAAKEDSRCEGVIEPLPAKAFNAAHIKEES
eukprot:1160921-Pelagomonas_calceolata.AAC.4